MNSRPPCVGNLDRPAIGTPAGRRPQPSLAWLAAAVAQNATANTMTISATKNATIAVIQITAG